MPMHHFVIKNQSEINESIYTSYAWDTHEGEVNHLKREE